MLTKQNLNQSYKKKHLKHLNQYILKTGTYNILKTLNGK